MAETFLFWDVNKKENPAKLAQLDTVSTLRDVRQRL